MIFFAIVFRILRALNIDKHFKANHIWEIKGAYIIFSLVIAHLLTTIILRFYDWAILIIN